MLITGPILQLILRSFFLPEKSVSGEALLLKPVCPEIAETLEIRGVINLCFIKKSWETPVIKCTFVSAFPQFIFCIVLNVKYF